MKRTFWLKPLLAFGLIGLSSAASADLFTNNSGWPTYKHKLSLGLLSIQPQAESGPLRLSVPDSILPSAQAFQASDDTTVDVANSETPGLFYTYSINKNWGIEVFGGLPPEIELHGKGTVVAPANLVSLPNLPIIGQLPVLGGGLNVGGLTQVLDLGDMNGKPLATAKAWSPTVIATYTFFDEHAFIRPYLGFGMSYSFFTDLEMNPRVEEQLNEKALLIAAITANPNALEIRVKPDAEPVFSAVGTIGLNINLTKQFGITASASYLPTRTTIEINATDSKGHLVANAKSDVDIDPIIYFVALSYRFGTK